MFHINLHQHHQRKPMYGSDNKQQHKKPNNHQSRV